MQIAANPLTVNGNWTNSGGTFSDAGALGVIFATTATSTITGSTTFNVFTCNTPGKTLIFDHTAAQQISGSFTINSGAVATTPLISILSDLSGSQAGITFTGTATSSVTRAAVQDSLASGVATAIPIAAATCTNQGNNTGWTFPGGAAFTWTGATTDWNVGSNWNIGQRPRRARHRYHLRRR